MWRSFYRPAFPRDGVGRGQLRRLWRGGRLGSIIQRLKKQLGFTSIVVTHDMRFAKSLADTVLFLHQGKAQFFGPLEEFLASNEEEIRKFLTLDAYLLP